jgi:hypothetical protein
MEGAIDTMRGAVIMGCFLAAVFFARYWHLSRDRFYGFFTAAMLLLALNWGALIRYDATGQEEARHIIYLLRLLAFLLIAAGIVDKNRRSRR